MREHLPVSQTDKCNLAKVRMRREVLERMQTLSQKPVRLVLVFLTFRLAGLSAHLYAPLERAPDEGLGGVPCAGLVCDVVLHAGFRIDLEFLGIHWRPEVGVILSRIFAFTVAFRVV